MIEEPKILECRQCDLCLDRTQIVNGSGNLGASIMLVGEAPGYHEDKKGLPFVGNSGKLLDYYLDLINLTRDQVYITNIVKCRPNANRTPTQLEINRCKQYLRREILYIKPKIIVCLGGIAASVLVPNFTKVSDYRMKPIVSMNTLILTMYHPSFILQNKLFDLYHYDWYFLAKAYRLLCNPFHYCEYDKLNKVEK